MSSTPPDGGRGRTVGRRPSEPMSVPGASTMRFAQSEERSALFSADSGDSLSAYASGNSRNSYGSTGNASTPLDATGGPHSDPSTASALLNTASNNMVEPLLENGTRVDAKVSPDSRCCCCSVRSRVFRSLILFLACSLTFGSYFAYDNPGALTHDFKIYISHNSTAYYEWMYSIYSWPNTVQPFIGGILIDRFFGLRSAAITFCLLIAVGTSIVAAAGSIGSSMSADEAKTSYLTFYIAVAGRFVFGLGGESLTVTQNTFIARWFSGRELATAFAITLSFSRIGSALNFVVEKPISNTWGFHWALWASSAFCFLSLLAGFQLSYLDRLGEQLGVVGQKDKTRKSKKSDIEADGDSGISATSNTGASTGGGCDEDEDSDEEDEEPKCSDVGKVLRLRETLMYFICLSFYVAVFVFITIASQFFQRKFDLKPSVANSYVAIPYTVSACISPFLGFLIDWMGYSAQLVFLASCSLAAIHVCFATTMLPPFPMMIWMGVTYSLCAASLWPMVALIVPIKQLGTAYGLMTALQNLGLAVVPLAIGPMVDDDILESYIQVEWIFAGCSAASAVLTLCLMSADGWLGKGLLYSSSGRIRKIQAKKLKEERARAKERARLRESQAASRMLRDDHVRDVDRRSDSNAGSKQLQKLTNSWQSTFSGTGTMSNLSSPGGEAGVFSPKTTVQLRSDYFRRLDILLRRKGGLS